MKNSKKYLVTGLAILIATAGIAAGANAKTSVHKKTSHISGTVVSVSSDSFSLKTKKTTYTVDVNSDTSLLSKTGKTIKISDIKTNDSIKATGKISGKTMAATKVKDKS